VKLRRRWEKKERENKKRRGEKRGDKNGVEIKEETRFPNRGRSKPG